MGAIDAVTTTGEIAALCLSVGLARAPHRRRQPARAPTPTVRAASPRALVPAERHAVLDVLHSERFVDQSPAEVHATLLEVDGEQYVAILSGGNRLLLSQRGDVLRAFKLGGTVPPAPAPQEPPVTHPDTGQEQGGCPTDC